MEVSEVKWIPWRLSGFVVSFLFRRLRTYRRAQDLRDLRASVVGRAESRKALADFGAAPKSETVAVAPAPIGNSVRPRSAGIR
jgi:hypothetical protein